MIDELQKRVTYKHYLEESLELTNDLAIISDTNGIILFANSASEKFLKLSNKEIINLNIANIFESLTQFGMSKDSGKPVMEVQVNLIFHRMIPLPVLLSVRDLTNPEGQVDGYLYIIKEVKV